MTDTDRLPIPHRQWCSDPGNVYRFEDHGIQIARCRSCRAELIDWPDDDESRPE